MSKKQEQQSRLLAETFHDDWTTGRAAEFARAAAGVARRRRLSRQTLGAAAVVFLVAALVFVLTPRRHETMPTTIAASPRAAAAPAYEIISDDELLAHLRDQPVLVVKRPDGRREITLLPTPDSATETLE